MRRLTLLLALCGMPALAQTTLPPVFPIGFFGGGGGGIAGPVAAITSGTISGTTFSNNSGSGNTFTNTDFFGSIDLEAGTQGNGTYFIETPFAQPALAIDVTQPLSTKSVTAPSTFTLLGSTVPGQIWSLLLTNNDSSRDVMTLPSGIFSLNTGATRASFKQQPATVVHLGFFTDASGNTYMTGDPTWNDDLPTTTTLASGDLLSAGIAASSYVNNAITYSHLAAQVLASPTLTGTVVGPYATAGILTNNSSGTFASLSNASSVNSTLMGILGTGWSNSSTLFLAANGTWVAGGSGATLGANNSFTGANTFGSNFTTFGGTAWSFGALPSGATTTAPDTVYPATTFTVTGTNTATNFQANYHGIPTFTDSSAGTVTDLFNTFYAGPAAGAGSLVVTRAHTLGILDSTASNNSNGGAVWIGSTLGTASTAVTIGNGIINAGGNIIGLEIEATNGVTTPTEFLATAQNLNSTITLITGQNTGTSTAAVIQTVLKNNAENFVTSLLGTGNTGSATTGSPTGEAAGIATTGTTGRPIYISAGSTYEGGYDPTKGWLVDNTVAGSTGAQTQNTTEGTVQFAAAATSLVVTNSMVSATSRVFCFLQTNDATAVLGSAVAGSGSFTINMKTAPTGTTVVAYQVHN
jgi:hypothetical protein